MREGCIPALGKVIDRRAFFTLSSKLVSGNIPRRRTHSPLQLTNFLFGSTALIDVVMAAPKVVAPPGMNVGRVEYARAQLSARGSDTVKWLSINFDTLQVCSLV